MIAPGTMQTWVAREQEHGRASAQQDARIVQLEEELRAARAQVRSEGIHAHWSSYPLSRRQCQLRLKSVPPIAK